MMAYHDIIEMPISYSQDVSDHTVASAALDEGI